MRWLIHSNFKKNENISQISKINNKLIKVTVFNNTSLQEQEKIIQDIIENTGRDIQVASIWQSSGECIQFFECIQIFLWATFSHYDN